jgi:hypothetical protein
MLSRLSFTAEYVAVVVMRETMVGGSARGEEERVGPIRN